MSTARRPHEAAATAVNGDGAARPRPRLRAPAARGSFTCRPTTCSPATPTAPYPEDAPTAPLNAYGRSKLAGERAVLRPLPDAGYVVRTAWLYGAHGPQLRHDDAAAGRRARDLDVVDDQLGPADLDRAIWPSGWSSSARRRGRPGRGLPRHRVGADDAGTGSPARCSRLAGLDPERVRRTTSAAYVTPGRAGPSYSVLGHDRWAAAGMAPMRDWHSMLTAALHDPAFAAVLGGAG